MPAPHGRALLDHAIIAQRPGELLHVQIQQLRHRLGRLDVVNLGLAAVALDEPDVAEIQDGGQGAPDVLAVFLELHGPEAVLEVLELAGVAGRVVAHLERPLAAGHRVRVEDAQVAHPAALRK